MKRTFKKTLSIILSTAILVCSVPFTKIFSSKLIDFSAMFTSKATAIEESDLPDDFDLSLYNVKNIFDPERGNGRPYQVFSDAINLYSCSKVVYDAFSEDAEFVASVELWEAIRLVSNPANLAKYIKFQQQYEEVIFAVLFNALENQKYVELSYSKQLSKATSLMNKMLKSERTAELLDKTSLDGTEKKELINIAMAFLTEGEDIESKWTALGEYIDIVKKWSSIIEGVVEGGIKAANIVNSTSMYVSMLDAGVEIIDYLYDLKAYAPNSAFGAAVQTVIDTVSNDWVGIVGKTIVDVGFVFGEEAIKKLIDYAWTGCCAMLPFLGGMLIGEKIGTVASNLLFATEDMIEQFEYLKIIDQVETASCALFEQYGNSCKASANSTNSAQLMVATDFSYALYCFGAEAAIEMMNIGCNKGIVSTVVNFFDINIKDYNLNFDEFKEAAQGCQKTASTNYGQMKNYWKWDIESDYPHFFSILHSNNIEPQHIESITLDRDEVVFCVGEIMSFKWDIMPINYEGEIGLKSDNEVVIKSREPMGILTYALEENIGTANVTIYSVDNPEICDTIKITVVKNDDTVDLGGASFVLSNKKLYADTLWMNYYAPIILDEDDGWIYYDWYHPSGHMINGFLFVGLGINSRNDVLNMFTNIRNAWITVEPNELGNYGTGSVVQIRSSSDNEELATYQIVVRGDVNGDNCIDEADISEIELQVNYRYDWLWGSYGGYEVHKYLAADVNGNMDVDSADADLISLASNYMGIYDMAKGGEILLY